MRWHRYFGRRPENAGQGGRGGEGRNAAVFDKYHPKCFLFTRKRYARGGRPQAMKRKILKVVVQAAQEQQQRRYGFDLPALEQADKEVVSAACLRPVFGRWFFNVLMALSPMR